MKILPYFIAVIILGSLAASVAAKQLSAKGIFEGSLQETNHTTSNQRYEGIETSILLYDSQDKITIHNLNESLGTGQKFKIQLKSTVNGLLQVVAKNTDGTQVELPSIYVQRGKEIRYPPLNNTVFELNQQTGLEELILTLIPEDVDVEQFSGKGIFEGVLLEDVTPQASYIIQSANTSIIKHIILKHH